MAVKMSVDVMEYEQLGSQNRHPKISRQPHVAS